MIAIALIHPEIPQNTGNIARLSVAIGAELMIVEPCGFDLSESAVRRAGLDYWEHVKLTRFPSLEEFRENTAARRLVGVDPGGTDSFRGFEYREDDILCFGRESTGLDFLPETSVYIPMMPNCRSINLANATAIVGYEAVKNFGTLERPPKSPAWGGKVGRNL